MQDFTNQWLGKSIDYDKVYGYQCVDLVKLYLSQVFGLKPGAWGNAIDYWEHTNAALYTKFDRLQTSDAKAGDIVVFRGLPGNAAGHIGIATGNTRPDSVEVLEQNGSTGNGSGKGPDAIRTRFITRSRVAGVLRPKAPTPPQQTIPVHPYAWAVGKRVYLKPVPTWRVYKPGTKEVVGTLLPAKFGGLSYVVRDVDAALPNRVIVQSTQFGRVSLPLDGDAVIK